MTTARWLGIALAIIAAVAAAPFVLALGTGLVAAALGCQLDEGGVRPCVALGVDFGAALYAAGLIGIIMLILVPLAGIAFLIWLVAGGMVVLAPRLRKH
jgi:hypothetical protein